MRDGTDFAGGQYMVFADAASAVLVAAARMRGIALVERSGEPVAGLLLGWDDDREAPDRRLRARCGRGDAAPVMLLARSGRAQALAAALDAGADEVAAADAPPDEIAARLAAMLRRTRSTMLRVGDLAIDRLAQRASRDGRPLDLLPREYAILVHLAQHAGRCISRSSLLRDVWGLRFDPGTNVVQVHMSRLRAKLDRGFSAPMLHTEKGKGYRLAPPIPA